MARGDAPAKVNLWLHVEPPDASGYHPLDTLFCALTLADTVTVRSRPAGVTLRVEGAELGEPRRNLAWRAADAFLSAIQLRGSSEPGGPAAPFTGADITLHKRVPVAAGLGGGSSDAAATLRALDVLHGSPLPAASLMELAATLGADVPFFLCGSSLARGSGYGERLEPLPSLPAAPVLVAVPPEPMGTADAYARLDAARGPGSAPAPAPGSSVGSWGDVARASHNDFETVVLPRIPGLAEALRLMDDAGARLARLAGSGSAVFGVFEEESGRARAAESLAARLPRLRLISTWTGTAAPPVERTGPFTRH